MKNTENTETKDFKNYIAYAKVRFKRRFLLAGSLLTLLLFGPYCTNTSKQFSDPFLFSDGLSSGGVALFSLLDDYPALKNAMAKLEPDAFNKNLNVSLEKSRKDIPEALSSLSTLLKNKDSNIRPALKRVSSIINRVRKVDSVSSRSTSFSIWMKALSGEPESRSSSSGQYQNALNYMERVRAGQRDFLVPLLPLDYTILNYLRNDPQFIATEYYQKLKETGKSSLSTEETDELRKAKIQSSINNLVESLKGQQAYDVVTYVEEILHKAINKNSTTKSGIAQLLQGVFDETLLEDRVFKDKLITLLEGLGNMMSVKAGTGDGSKTAATVLKELIINAEKYYTTGGSVYDSDSNYNETGYSTNFANMTTDLYVKVRNLIQTPESYIKDTSTPLLSLLATAYNKLTFTENITSIDSSLTEMIKIDLTGKERLTNSESEPGSSLESLLFTLSMVDIFGYYWNNDQEKTQIIGMSGGILTLGDAAFSLGSKMSSPAPAPGDDSVSNLGLTAVLNSNYTQAQVNGKVTRDGENYPINLNTSALSLSEGQTRGRLNSATDSVYTKTIPFVLAMIADTLYSGKGPYYNKNRKDSSGNYVTPDGTIYRDSSENDMTYKSQWKTSSYKIEVEKVSKGYKNYAGLDGTESTNIANGTSYTIPEIEIPDTDRAVASDEEAFYKNFQWLLYKKRMVLVIPVHVDALGNELREAVYATVVANGLKGLMNVKPYCTTTCSEQDSGIWLKAGKRIKTGYDTVGDLTYFSDIAADSSFLIQVWGYGISNDSYGFTDTTIYQQVYRLLFAKYNEPSRFYGPIPPAIKWNFDVIEKLGFVTDSEITPDSTSDNWDKRNKLLPLVAALANAMTRQADSDTNKNPFALLTELAQVLARPHIHKTNDPVALNDLVNPQAIEIVSLKIRGSNNFFGIRSPQMPTAELYYPNEDLRSFLATLTEDEIRDQDGLVSLLGKGTLLTSLGELLFELGKDGRETMRSNFVGGLQKIVNEMRVTAEITDAETQFDVEKTMQSLHDDLAAYPDSRPKDNLDDSSWEFFDNLTIFLTDIFSTNSVYKYTDNLSRVFDSLIEAKPSADELEAFVSILGSILVDPSTGQQDYILRTLVTQDVPAMLPHLAPGGMRFVGLARSLAKPGQFMDYFYPTITSDYPLDSIFQDVERFCASAEVQDNSGGKSDLLYSTGVILEHFSGVVEQGRKPSEQNAWFQDQWNETDTYLPYFDRFNYIFSTK
ncbi:MAG: hypothetical protein AAF518_09325 [Spirochaetota bacterium]